jgi:uncharacterized protein YqfB (UPF0267 family)
VLRFRAEYVPPILAGVKSETLRRDVSSGVRVGAVVDAACRYDRPPFARLRVTAVEAVLVRELEAEQREQVKRLYRRTGALVRVRFELALDSPTSAIASGRSMRAPL